MNVKGFLSVFFLATLPSMAWAQAVGTELQVNTFTTGTQRKASVASDSAGNFVVVWTSYGQDGYGAGVFGQRFDNMGYPLDGEFPVNTYITGDQRNASVASDASGNFVVVWESYPQDDGFGIFGQRFDNSGNPVGTEFQVNSYTTGNQRYPAVASDAGGDFVVVWNTYGDQDGSYRGIAGQLFDPSGGTVGSELQVNSYTTGSQDLPAVSMDVAGNFVVVWESPQDGSGRGIFGQRFDNAGIAVGSEFSVNTFTTGSQERSAVASDQNGNFVVVWTSYGDHDGDYTGIFGQRFDNSGAPAGTEFQVNSFTTGTQLYPSVASDDLGRFVVVWQSYAQDGSEYGIFGQQFDASGAAAGGEFQANSHTTGRQWNPSVASASNGDFVVAWNGYDDQDGDGSGIFAQRFQGGAVDPEALLQDLVDFVAALDPSDFSNPNYQRTLLNKLSALAALIGSGDLSTICEAINKLENDIIRKVDGVAPPADWVIDEDARLAIYEKAIALVLALKDDANALGGCP